MKKTLQAEIAEEIKRYEKDIKFKDFKKLTEAEVKELERLIHEGKKDIEKLRFGKVYEVINVILREEKCIGYILRNLESKKNEGYELAEVRSMAKDDYITNAYFDEQEKNGVLKTKQKAVKKLKDLEVNYLNVRGNTNINFSPKLFDIMKR